MDLTPRNIYMQIKSFLTPRLKFTLSSFWWDFLSSSIPGKILDPYFELKPKRPRSLTPMMTGAKAKSFPVQLHRYLEENLNPEDFLSTVKWVNDILDQKQIPDQLHQIITEFEAQIDEGVAYMLPMSIPTDGSSRKKFFMASLRLTWLGFFALYHDRECGRLISLMNDLACSPENLWQAYSASPGTRHAVVSAPAELTEKVGSMNPATQSQGKNDGWYAVANWTDEYICMNDRPMPSYEGCNVLAEIPNGTILYVTKADDYKGLHCSTGQWGETSFNDMKGFVPLNLMLKLMI